MTNKIFKSDLEAVKYIVKQSGETSWMLEKTTGISRQQIDRWLKNETKAIRRPTINKLAEKLGYQITHNNRGVAVSPHTKQTSGDNNMEIGLYEDHIALQKDKIITLEKENLHLKQSLKAKTPESSHWDDLKFHYQTEVELHWTSFGVLGRTIWSVSNLKEQSKILGYSESKLKAMWDVGTKYPDMSQHPIDDILHQDSKDELQDIAKTLPTVFGAIKDMIGNHYIPTKLMYRCKNGSFVGAISYNKIEWTTQKVYSKIAFLIDPE
tara:strand:+ start:1130 stop:1927 length:798 start_codon:yes stop_codon:yes gene_type:complete